MWTLPVPSCVRWFYCGVLRWAEAGLPLGDSTGVLHPEKQCLPSSVLWFLYSEGLLFPDTVFAKICVCTASGHLVFLSRAASLLHGRRHGEGFVEWAPLLKQSSQLFRKPSSLESSGGDNDGLNEKGLYFRFLFLIQPPAATHRDILLVHHCQPLRSLAINNPLEQLPGHVSISHFSFQNSNHICFLKKMFFMIFLSKKKFFVTHFNLFYNT